MLVFETAIAQHEKLQMPSLARCVLIRVVVIYLGYVFGDLWCLRFVDKDPLIGGNRTKEAGSTHGPTHSSYPVVCEQRRDRDTIEHANSSPINTVIHMPRSFVSVSLALGRR